jgi:hypothetical protein
MAWGLSPNFNPDKQELIDLAFEQYRPRIESVADLGGIWNVDGAYALYAIRKFGIAKACIVDTDFSEASRTLSQNAANLQLIQGNFGDETVAAKVGMVDAVFLFDVLLHQVHPDWNEVLGTYAKRTNCFIIFNQQWIRSDTTIRLLDLGREEYFRNVPIGPDNPTYRALFERMYEIHPQYGRVWRDIHKVWQWGITDEDLRRTMRTLGFEQCIYRNYGRFGSLSNFENHGFVFQRSHPGDGAAPPDSRPTG